VRLVAIAIARRKWAGDGKGIMRPSLERGVPAQSVALELERSTGDSFA
jgi:hypothetical protein